MRSNLERSVGGSLIFLMTEYLGLYFDWIGLAAAKTAVLAFN